jgi:oligosaccharyltransferase complex subunit beta
MEFTEAGGNMIIGVNSDLSQVMRNLVENCGVDFDRKGAAVIDHFSFEPSIDSRYISFFNIDYIIYFIIFINNFNFINSFHTAILTNNTINSEIILGKYKNSKPILYRGIGHSLDESNILGIKVLRGNPTSYSVNVKHMLDRSPEKNSVNKLLVSVLQARNNARILISGSIDMFSNMFFRKKQTSSNSYVGNELFCEELSKWAFGESGILRFRDIVHHKSDGNSRDSLLYEKEKSDLPKTLYPDPELNRNSLVYRIKDEIIFSMIVEEYFNNTWIPFSANDMQLELVMLDPYVRKNMSSDPTTGKFESILVAPDNYGIFKFRFLYRRIGYSVLHSETQVSIRPFNHDENERFIVSAYPYYFSSMSALIVFFIFSFVFLLS